MKIVATIVLSSLLVIALTASTVDRNPYKSVTSADPQDSVSLFRKGKLLFRANCGACHSMGMAERATASALGGVTKRRTKNWLYSYTRNSIEMFDNNDSIAIELREQNGNMLMTSFPHLTDKDLDAIYYFVEKQYKLSKRK